MKTCNYCKGKTESLKLGLCAECHERACEFGLKGTFPFLQDALRNAKLMQDSGSVKFLKCALDHKSAYTSEWKVELKGYDVIVNKGVFNTHVCVITIGNPELAFAIRDTISLFYTGRK